MAGLIDLRPYGHGGLGEDVPRARGFDPASVEYAFLTIQGLDQQFGVYTPRTPSGERALQEAGYNEVEIPNADEGVSVYYMDNEQYDLYLSARYRQIDRERAEYPRRLEVLRRGGSAAEARVKNAVKELTLFSTGGIAFDGHQLLPRGPNVTEEDRQTARAVLEDQGLISHRTERSGTEYYLTPTQWDAYERSGGILYLGDGE